MTQTLTSPMEIFREAQKRGFAPAWIDSGRRCVSGRAGWEDLAQNGSAGDLADAWQQLCRAGIREVRK